MAREQSYRDLIGWQNGVDLVEAVYRVTQGWPKEEMSGLTSQARRAAVAVPADVAEGQGRSGPKGFSHHLSVAHGSLCEVETHPTIAHRLGSIDRPTLDRLFAQASEGGRIIQGLIRSLR